MVEESKPVKYTKTYQQFETVNLGDNFYTVIPKTETNGVKRNIIELDNAWIIQDKWD